MVLKRCFGVAVTAETLVGFVVVYPVRAAMPVGGAFDAKVVMGFAGQFAIAITTLQHALRQCNAGGYAVGLHLLAGSTFVSSHVLLRGHLALVHPAVAGSTKEQKQKQ